jgi:hypothetical protein
MKDSGLCVDRIIREFLKIGEAVAGRWIQMPQSVLLLQMVPGRPDTGAIYLYDRQDQMFYMIGFDAHDDDLTVHEFEQLVREYGLLFYASQPTFAQTVARLPWPRPSLVGMPLTGEVAADLSLDAELAGKRCRTFPSRLRERRRLPGRFGPWLQGLGSA